MSSRRTYSSNRPVLIGGVQRRRRWPRVLAVVTLTAVAALALVVTLGATRAGDSDSPSNPPPQASQTTAVDEHAVAPPPEKSPSATDPEQYAVNTSLPDPVQLRFMRKPRAGLLFDVRSGRVLWRRNPTRRLAIASLTKMMTALLIAEHSGPHERVRITRRAVRTAGSGVGVLPKGKKVQLEALLNGLLLVSGNDAAVALSQHEAGTVRGFVRRMNVRAAELGLSSTHFSTPHGLRDARNYSTALDLAALARADLAERRIRRITRRDRAIVKFPIKGGRLFLYNNNPLIRTDYPGTTGLKTGYTDRAGRSIVATVKRGSRHLGVVLLHSYDPAEQARKLFRRGFEALRRPG